MKFAKPDLDPNVQILCRVLASALHHRCLPVYAATESVRCEPWFGVSGVEHLEKAVKQNTGVVLVSTHLVCGHLAPMVVARLGYEILSIDRSNRYEAAGWNDDRLTVVSLSGGQMGSARSMLQGQRALRSGKICHVAADGFRFETGVEKPFLDRTRHFATGFAELAADVNATVIPVIVPIDENGRLEVRFFDPLEAPGTEESREAKVDHLLDQYVQHLEEIWKTYPGNVPHRRWTEFIQQPQVPPQS